MRSVLLDEPDDIDVKLFSEDPVCRGSEDIPLVIGRRVLKGEHPVRVLREYRRMSESQLANKAGISRMQIVCIETGRVTPSSNTLMRIARALKVSPADIA